MYTSQVEVSSLSGYLPDGVVEKRNREMIQAYSTILESSIEKATTKEFTEALLGTILPLENVIKQGLITHITLMRDAIRALIDLDSHIRSKLIAVNEESQKFLDTLDMKSLASCVEKLGDLNGIAEILNFYDDKCVGLRERFAKVVSKQWLSLPELQ